MINSHDIAIIKKRIDRMKNTPLYIALIIVAISLSTIYSVTLNKELSFFKKEIVWTGLGVIAYIVFSFIDYRVYGKYYKVIYVCNILVLALVLIAGVHGKGAKRWIDLGFMRVQPSEFSKLFIILTLAEILKSKYSSVFAGFKSVILTFFHVLPIFLLIAIQPDLGTSLVIVVLYLVLIFVHGIDYKTIIKITIIGISMIPIGYFFLLKEYQKKRVLTFLNPESDLLGSGWNVMQSMIAVGSGGIYGKGFLKGTQSKLEFLPEAHTDFIAAIFLEERGLIGGIILISLYILLIFQILMIGDKSEEYGKLVCYGIATIFFFHTVVNIGMIIGIVPVTGLPLIFMSYGGTSFLFAFTMLGIVQSVNIYRE